MSNKKAGLSGLINQADLRKTTSGQSASKLLASNSKAAAPSVSKLVGVGPASISAQPKEQRIQFGSPSSTSTGTAAQGGGVWKSLLSNAMSGGASGALSSFGGIGGLISGLAGLFGGSSKSALPPLTLFTLPSSQQQTSYVHTDNVNTPAASGPVYTAASAKSGEAPSMGTNMMDSAAIAAAVKNALLTSNSLGDVISEL